ncbi:MAG: iron ABC transporter permease [Chloroflexi bacterium]|nr:iron ABC transporter permease [Chloroflexota bacterium]
METLATQTAVQQKKRRHWRSQWNHLSPYWLVLVGGALFTAVLILLVPAYLLIRMGSAWAETVETLSKPRTLAVLGNTVWLAAAVTLSTAALAVPIAWLTTRTDLPGRRLWAVLTALPLVVPSYVFAYLYVTILAPKGLAQQLLQPLGVNRLDPIYGFKGAFLVLTLVSYPYTLLTVRAALARMDPALLEAARSLGLSQRQAFWRVTLPYLRPSILVGSLLVSLYVLRDFGAVTLLQYSTFTRIIYNRYLSYKLDAAAAMAFVLVLLTAVILLLEWRARGKSRYARVSVGAARRLPPIPLGKWKLPALLFVGTVVFWALLVPVVTLSYWLWRGLNRDWAVRTPGGTATTVEYLISLLEPAWNSISVAAMGAFLAVLLALPITILAVRHPGKTSHFFERLTYASFALPGIVVALAYVFIGVNYARPLYQTMPMLLAAYLVLFIPQAVGAERASLMQVSPSLEEAGRSLGKRPFAVLRRITLPLVRPGIVAGATLVFLTIMKELPATLILSPLGFNSLSMQVWSNIGEALFARAAAPTLLLILLSSVPLAWLTLRGKDER